MGEAAYGGLKTERLVSEGQPYKGMEVVLGLFGGGTRNPISGRFGRELEKEVWLTH